MTPQQQLDGFIDRFTPDIAATIRRATAMVSRQLPGASILVYDNYNALAIGFGASDKVRSVVCSVAGYPRWVSLFLSNGPTLPDPEGLLEGAGNSVRHVKLTGDRMENPAVAALIDAAAARAAYTVGVRSYFTTSAMAAEDGCDSNRIGEVIPALRRATPSSVRATPSRLAPPCNAAFAASSAPWP